MNDPGWTAGRRWTCAGCSRRQERTRDDSPPAGWVWAGDGLSCATCRGRDAAAPRQGSDRSTPLLEQERRRLAADEFLRALLATGPMKPTDVALRAHEAGFTMQALRCASARGSSVTVSTRSGCSSGATEGRREPIATRQIREILRLRVDHLDQPAVLYGLLGDTCVYWNTLARENGLSERWDRCRCAGCGFWWRFGDLTGWHSEGQWLCFLCLPKTEQKELVARTERLERWREAFDREGVEEYAPLTSEIESAAA